MGSTRLINRRRNEQGLKWPRIAIAFLATVGVIDTGSITLDWLGWLGGSLSCPGGLNGCQQVLNSAWGTIELSENIIFPLSFLGFLSYLLLLIFAALPFLPIFSENKIELSKKTWWGLFYFSCGMTVFSLLLISLMLFKINGFCFFCILSALISTTIFSLTIIGGGWKDSGKLIFRGFLISLSVLIVGLTWTSLVDPSRQIVQASEPGSPPLVQRVSTPKEIALAEHLSNNGAVMYSAYWCPHCHDQKEMFGQAGVEKLKVIECAEDGKNNQRELCQAKGIEGYPSWEINGEIYPGVISLKELAKISDFTY